MSVVNGFVKSHRGGHTWETYINLGVNRSAVCGRPNVEDAGQCWALER